MELQTVANILVATSIAHALHSLMEPINIRSKVLRLVSHMDKKPVKEMPVNIDTRLKALSAGYGLFLIVFIVANFIVSAIDPALSTAMWIAIWLIVIVEIINTIIIDKYHVDIEHVTKRFKK